MTFKLLIVKLEANEYQVLCLIILYTFSLFRDGDVKDVNRLLILLAELRVGKQVENKGTCRSSSSCVQHCLCLLAQGCMSKGSLGKDWKSGRDRRSSEFSNLPRHTYYAAKRYIVLKPDLNCNY